MKILGIDYGKSKVGLSLADGPLAEPLKVIRYKDPGILRQGIERVIKEERIDKVIVGVSEGKMGEESKKFGLTLSKRSGITVETFDETLTSQDAQRMSVEAGVSRKKRRKMEDAYAATIMLQNYLDSQS